MSLLILLLIMNLMSCWLYHWFHQPVLLFIWLLLCQFASYAWVARYRKPSFVQLLRDSLIGLLWLPFSGLIAFSLWRYSWQPPGQWLDQFNQQRWQLLPLLVLGYCGLVWLTSYLGHNTWKTRLTILAGWAARLVILALGLVACQILVSHLTTLPGQRLSARILWLFWLTGKYLLWLDLLLRLRQQRLQLPVKWLGLVVLLCLIGWPFSGQLYPEITTTPKIIAHRGADQTNIPNTIPAFKAILPEQPALAEIDLQLTGDQQFIVSHDADTARLTGKKQKIAKTSLAKLQRLTLKTAHRSVHYASFKAYLAIAQHAKQPLLVEIKPALSAQICQQFYQRYRLLLPAGTQFHSAHLQTVTRLQREVVQPVGYIMPFTATALPKTTADFYSLDWHLLNPLIIAQANQQGQPIYAWTVNQNWLFQAMRQFGVSGVITDRTAQMQRQAEQPASYTSGLILLLLNF